MPMQIHLALFGAFRDYDASGQIQLQVEGGQVADLRAALQQYGQQHWPGFRPELLANSAFANERQILRDGEPLPGDGRMAVLPPVSGG